MDLTSTHSFLAYFCPKLLNAFGYTMAQSIPKRVHPRSRHLCFFFFFTEKLQMLDGGA